MKTIIVEDEINACEYLRTLIAKHMPECEVIDHLDSVQETINWLHNNPEPELIFLDIQLSDGVSFEIFNHVEIKAPIIFTTAYDQFALQAFKVNSVDYLLKPISEDDLIAAHNKLKLRESPGNNDQLTTILKNFSSGKKNRCLVKKGNHFEFINVDEIAFINSDDSITFLYSKDGKRHIYTKTLQVLMNELDHDNFFQINRKQIINIESISKIHPFLNQRLKVDLALPSDIEFIVARNRMAEFKEWVDS